VDAAFPLSSARERHDTKWGQLGVRTAHREELRTKQGAEEWLLIEWPDGHKEPMKYWLSTLSEDVALQRMVFEAKMRWRIERDYQDIKQELGLGHYEGRGWQGFPPPRQPEHCGLRVLDGSTASVPRWCRQKNSARSEEPTLPTHYKPRGSPAQPSARSATSHHRSRLCGCVSPPPCSRPGLVAPAACGSTVGFVFDTVRLGGWIQKSNVVPTVARLFRAELNCVPQLAFTDKPLTSRSPLAPA
jgi:hypothetical protein